MSNILHSINVSAGGVPKLPVNQARVTVRGVEGDSQRNRRYHGGPDRAVCLYSLDLIRQLQQEGHPIEPGTIGENLTVAGIEWTEVVPGAGLMIGEVELEVTSFTKPCKTIRKSFSGNDIDRIAERYFRGWSRVYAKVVKDGLVQVGDPVRITPPALETRAILDLFQSETRWGAVSGLVP